MENAENTDMQYPSAAASERVRALVYMGAWRGLSTRQVLEQALKQRLHQLDDAGCVRLLLTLEQLVDDPAKSPHGRTCLQQNVFNQGVNS
jgi:hypothetical protein